MFVCYELINVLPDEGPAEITIRHVILYYE